eukprot:COSAG02_NODE_3278_length_7026_cov_28.128771_3_plen_49_part_00
MDFCDGASFTRRNYAADDYPLRKRVKALSGVDTPQPDVLQFGTLNPQS